MPTYTMPVGINNTGEIDGSLTYISGNVPFLFPGLLLFVYLAVMLTGYGLQNRRTSRGNFPMWSAIAGLITTTLGFFLFLVPGYISLETLSVCVSITLLSALWFMFTPDD